MKRILFLLLLFSAMYAPQAVAQFPYPEIPAELRTPSDRASYLIKHFWEKADFSNMPQVEQGFADFISVFAPADSSARREAMRNLVEASSASDKIPVLVEDYLYTPASPVYNEEYFILYLEEALASAKISEAEKVRMRYLLSEAMLNRVGRQATDFEFTLPDGSTRTLYSMLPASGELMLIFYDPTCDTCHKVMDKLSADKSLNVLAVYPDTDTDLWLEHISEVPAGWTAGRADLIDVYAIREFPSVYVLDSKGTVLKKNLLIE